MTKRYLSAAAALSLLVGFPGCGNDDPVVATSQPPAAQTAPPLSTGGVTGTVLETLAAAPYTYLHLEAEGKQMWVAAPALTVKTGEQVTVPGKLMPMKNWHSKTLDRTFDLVYFAEAVRKAGEGEKAGGMPAGHPEVAKGGAVPAPSGTHGAAPGAKVPAGHAEVGHTKPAPVAAASIDFSGIARPEGGKTVGEIYEEKETLAGKQVVFRGKVVKASKGKIMGKHWVHVQDGTGEQKARDLTVTTATSTAKEGDTVVVTGKVVIDKDFGMGYKYEVIIEEATIEAE